jgi:hypothetical protein
MSFLLFLYNFASVYSIYNEVTVMFHKGTSQSCEVLMTQISRTGGPCLTWIAEKNEVAI